MAGGRISGHPIRESAQPPVSVGASASTRAAASPPAAAGRQAARPAELGGLARSPSSRASSSSTDGLSRHAALPVHATARETPADPLDVLNGAMRYIRIWSAVARDEREREALGPEHKGLSPDREVAYARSAIESIRKGLQALATLKRQRRLSPGYDTDAKEGELLQLLASAADIGVCTRTVTLNQIANQEDVFEAERSDTVEAGAGPDSACADPTEAPEPAGGGTSPSSSAKAASSALRALEQDPNQVQGWLGEFADCRAALDDIMRRAEASSTPKAVRTTLNALLPDVIYDKLRCCKGMQTLHGILAAASANRLADLTKQVELPELAARVDELCEAWYRRSKAMETAVEALVKHGAENQPAHHLTQQALAEHRAVIETYADGLDRVGLNLCLDAATGIEMDDAVGVWRSMMDVVHAIAAYKASLLALSETASRVKLQPGKMSGVPRPAPSPSEPPPAARPAQSSGGTGRKNRKHGKRSAGPSAPAPASASAPVDTRTPVQKHADALLKQCPVDRATAAQFGGNIVQIAQWLGEDTRLIQNELNDPTRDAVTAADFIRGSAGSWFGERDRVRSAKASLPPSDHHRIAQLADRLGALEWIERHMTALEADMLKCDRHPRSNHLGRLLAAGEIQRVGAPGRLPPAMDNDALGTLFEMRIQLKPLSNLQPTAPWFVHLHTEKPVTAQALSTMAFADFTAVHLKTDKEKNRGPRWEAVMRALGYTDAKVHRAAIGRELLRKLFAQAA
ncbi:MULTISPECIES: type III secretion system effector XopP [Ralstonia solanacearum species complex]|uniref:type III secretion system effector XopP n=1 Tax=Ralstonia solanacearum species complex TaxID=3116862 RepID=UPI000E57111C|nr:type III secretion system effector XopP [Ralstonia solanacearum]AXV77167.1 type III effector protein hlk1 [Ralstonia solanacearum]AXV91184.1 type III effector protein hlk1 [Ralstonia solanacearum]AXW76091.1 type III effector protein hlk1 [Ralstonia solanacearum]